jgi:mannose-6-phosphate isomerase-like protein (cupin superfamily)
MSKSHQVQKAPFIVPTDDGKYIAEHFGLATNGEGKISIAHMKAPPGWSEPFQTPEFDEYTFIIKGKKQFIINNEKVILKAGESLKIQKNTRVQYSNPFEEECEYLAICTPAFSIQTVHREH